jgi:hypothetical protein
MKLHQALATGKPIKRKKWEYWITPMSAGTITTEALFADDWEVKEEPRVVYMNEYQRAKDPAFGTVFGPVYFFQDKALEEPGDGYLGTRKFVEVIE